MSVNFDNLTGHESLAELEAALAAYDEHADPQAASPADTADMATPSDETGEQTAPPAVSEVVAPVAPAPEPAPTPDGTAVPDKVVLSKDGKHHIPYDVLEAERAQKQRLAAENARLKAEVAERETLQKVLEAHGIDPHADPDQLDVAGIEHLAQDYPEIGNVLTGIVTRLNAMRQPPAAPAAPATVPPDVQAALQAVPELKGWMESDPDRATFAISVDERLKEDPAWHDQPLTARFAEVAKRTRAAFGDDVATQPIPEPTPLSQAKPANDPPSAVKAPQPAVRDQQPASPSELGQSVQHHTTREKYDNLPREDIIAAMHSMTDAQIAAVLAEYDT